MKKLLIISISILISITSNAQMLCPNLMQYGVNISAEYSGSGHGANMEVNMVALNDCKSMELGVILNDDASKIKGADFKYKTFVGKYNYYYGNALIKPYVHYNCLYQMEFVFEPTMIETPTETFFIENETGGLISTIEHYIGAGIMVRFLNNFFLDSNIGFGAYFGSLNKSQAPNNVGIHKVNHGYTANFKVGIGYILR